MIAIGHIVHIVFDEIWIFMFFCREELRKDLRLHLHDIGVKTFERLYVVVHNRINHGKWIGVGGKFEFQESPEDCLLREVREETGLALTRWQFRGVVTFCNNEDEAEYMHLFTADGWEGTLRDCDEGELRWIPKDQIGSLNLWEGLVTRLLFGYWG